MFGFDWEFIGVVMTLIGIVWASIVALSKHSSKAALDKQNIETLAGKVAGLEADMKALTLANKQMSDSFHGDIKDLLIAFRGKSSE